MPCQECVDLQTHAFRSSDDLVHAVQVAAQESERGVLRPLRGSELTLAQQEALDSAHDTRALPGSIAYWFECRVCGDRFELVGDTERGSGSWTRREKGAGE